jgi:hypothetical protein
MSRIAIVTAVAVLSAFAATSASAQPAIRNPGAYSFTNPYLDSLNGGKETPALKLSSDSAAMQAYAARESGVGGSKTTVAVNSGPRKLSAYRETFASANPIPKRRHHRKVRRG